ncbi:MAG TPA: hypothetical protein PKA49_07090 [Tepidiformaceae bacterium]|nr:hypothetical protein [Tepidiformaceae bacterium]
MRPDAGRVLNGVAVALMTRVAPEIRTPFGQQLAGLSAVLLRVVATEFDRIADRLSVENAAVAAILSDAAAVLPDASLNVRAREAANAATPPDLRVSTLQAINDRLRAILVDVHAAIEETPGEEARAMEERIWEELRESTRRRHVEARV